MRLYLFPTGTDLIIFREWCPSATFFCLDFHARSSLGLPAIELQYRFLCYFGERWGYWRLYRISTEYIRLEFEVMVIRLESATKMSTGDVGFILNFPPVLVVWAPPKDVATKPRGRASGREGLLYAALVTISGPFRNLMTQGRFSPTPFTLANMRSGKPPSPPNYIAKDHRPTETIHINEFETSPSRPSVGFVPYMFQTFPVLGRSLFHLGWSRGIVHNEREYSAQ